MGENIRVRPAEKVELGAGRQEAEALMGNPKPVLSLQETVELVLQGMEMQHIGRCVIELSRR